MKKVILSFCLLLGVSYAASASDISYDLIKKEAGTQIAAIVSSSAPKEVAKAEAANDAVVTCTVTLHTNIIYHDVPYPITVTSTSDTCAHASEAAGAKADDIQSHYPKH